MFDVRDARVTFVAARGRPSPGWIRHARTQPASPCLGALPTRQRSGEGGMALWQPAECPRHVMCMRWVNNVIVELGRYYRNFFIPAFV